MFIIQNTESTILKSDQALNGHIIPIIFHGGRMPTKTC